MRKCLVLIFISTTFIVCSNKSGKFDEHYRLAEKYESKEQYKEAIKEWNLAVEADPDHKLAEKARECIYQATKAMEYDKVPVESVLQESLNGTEELRYKIPEYEVRESIEDEELTEEVIIDWDNDNELPPPPPPIIEDDDQIIFVPYDEAPVPIGGFEAIGKNLVYPEKARKAGVEGKVLVYAQIDVDGEVVRTRVMKTLIGCDEAAIEAIKSVKWKPAMNRDRPVKVWVMVPVEFRLN